MKQRARAVAAHLKTSKLLGIGLKLGLTVAAFWFALKDVDFAHLEEIVATQKSDGLIWAALMIVLQIVLGGVRWRLVLVTLSEAGAKTLSFLTAQRLYYISIFFNCCLPGTVGGDVIRVWLAKSSHIPLSLSIHSVIIDRLIALMALGLLVLATLSPLGKLLGFDARYWLAVLLVLMGIGMWLLTRLSSLFAPYAHLRPVQWLLQFLDCLRLMLKYPKMSLLSLLCAVLSHVSFCLCGYALAQSLNIELTVMQSITLIPLVLLISTIPISIGGWGVREAGMVGMLGLVGVPQAAALMLSVELGFLTIALSLPAAGLWLMHRKRTAEAPPSA